MRQIIEQAFTNSGFSLTNEQLEQFLQYYALLKEWNQKMNLTAIEEPVEVAYKHFVDSALLCRVIPQLAGRSLIDIGTGAGFPGVPLKIMESSLQLTLFDSLNKRITFLKEVCQQLQLSDVQTIHGRAEDFAQKIDYREQYDLASARAVARLPVLVEICLPFVKVGGYFIALKGPELEQEIAESSRALQLLGGKIKDVQKLTLLDGKYSRSIAVILKTAPTPKKYPRKAGTPQKSPL